MLPNQTVSSHEAIIAINPEAGFWMENDDTSKITWDEGVTPIAADVIEAKRIELQNALAAKKITDKNNRNSGKDKLKALGLTDDEITQLLGAKEA